MLPFASYLRPYRPQLIISLICLLFVGFLEPFSIVLLKPGLDVILKQAPRRHGAKSEDPLVRSFLPKGAVTETGSEWSELLGFTLMRDWAQKGTEKLEAVWTHLKKPLTPEPEEKSIVSFVASGINGVKEALKQFFAPVREWFGRKAVGSPFTALSIIAGILVVATILKGGFEYASNYILTWVMRRVSISLQTDIFQKIMLQDYLFFKGKTTGYLVSRIGSDVQLITNVTGNVIRDGLQQPLTLFFLTILLIWLSPAMSILAFCVLPVGGIVLYKFGKRLRKITKKSRKESDEQTSMLEEALRNYHIVKAFGTEKREIQRFQDQSEKIFHLSMKGRAIRFGTGPLMEALGALAMAGILMVGGYLVLIRGSLELSGFFVYLVALTRFYAPIKRLSRLNVRFQEAMVSSDRLVEMLSLQPGTTAPRGKPRMVEFRGSFRLDKATFGYEDDPVLKEITLEIPKGKMVALVGHSGAGKTTLLGLLSRLYDPDSGAVLLDGKDLRSVDVGGLRKLFGIVTQETVLFNDSVLQNIVYGAETCDRQKAEQCARAANAHDFIMELSQGYDTVIGQSGARLSGGQCQRLAIARALYRDPPVLLLDEATSHLDSRSELLVQQAIDRLLEGRTAVVIAHRLSTVRRADIIVILEHGRILQQGTHEELLAQVELYQNLYALQAPSG